jgi:hypothetical protein
VTTPRVVELVNGLLTTVLQTSLFVTKNVSNVWVVQKSSPSITQAGAVITFLDAGWYNIFKQNSAASVFFQTVGSTFSLSGGGGTQWNIIGPCP